MFYLHLSSVFDEQYCLQLIELAKNSGFNLAGVNIYGETKMREDIRNNSRVMWESKELANELELQIKQASINSYPHRFKEKQSVGLGSYFRMYRYEVGQYFKPHKDGTVNKEDTNSLITVLVYLNNTDGGETILMPDGFSKKDTWIKITPKVGDVLLFQHDCWHSGEQVKSGEKYVLRTDIFYKN
jgi:predicted 2-oxoglutarate/Fe(II)-dependent dioxygenase YbiX